MAKKKSAKRSPSAVAKRASTKRPVAKHTPTPQANPAPPGSPARITSRPPQIFPPRRDYASLSIKDLLDAREAYHVYLSTLSNVFATAIGRYFIHEDDWYAKNPPDRPRPGNVPRVTAPRTLANSVIRPWSWPAVVVFVRKWAQPDELGAEAVPRSLYLPDGRVIPTCVVEAAPDESLPPPAVGPFHASELLGGGYACLRDHQGQQSLGTIACLMTKGGQYYALTNRHVAGGDGEEVRAYHGGQFHRIGATSNYALDHAPFTTIFPAWSGSKVLLTLDAGLVRIDDITHWTSQAFGIGEIGEVFDATERTVTLDLIGCPVRAFGGVSGVIEGEIRALFYRYRSLGGFEYATDMLIGSRRNEDDAADRPRPKNARRRTNDEDPPPTQHPFTRPGDSGTLWFYDPPTRPRGEAANRDLEDAQPQVERGARARRLRPLALQWGGQRTILPSGEPSAYALSSFLSSISRQLDAEIVRDWSLGHDEYWGKTGHFSIGWKACDRVKGWLKKLMKANQKRIGFSDEVIGAGSEFRVGLGGYVPLADVADYVWLFPRGDDEAVQHFADIDIHDINGGPTLLEACIQDASNVSAKTWKSYFDGFAAAGVGPEEGALPFRVWQIWNAMVGYLKDGFLMHFVAAAGILAHYVGDASQPLHASFMHHGMPPMKTINGREYPFPRTSDEFKEFKETPEADIHAIYEQRMLEVDTATALAAVEEVLDERTFDRFEIASGHDAAVATVQIMADAQARLAPTDIFAADDPEEGPKNRSILLWNNANIRNATIECLADSVELLAALWTSAWKAGDGDDFAEDEFVTFEEEDLVDIYRHEDDFLPSMSLKELADSNDYEP